MIPLPSSALSTTTMDDLKQSPRTIKCHVRPRSRNFDALYNVTRLLILFQQINIQLPVFFFGLDLRSALPILIARDGHTLNLDLSFARLSSHVRTHVDGILLNVHPSISPSTLTLSSSWSSVAAETGPARAAQPCTPTHYPKRRSSPPGHT